MRLTTRATVCGILCLFWSAEAAIGFAHTEVTNDRIILHSGDYVPRFAGLTSNRLIVPVGKTVELPAMSDFDAIEVSGTLRISRTHDTICRFVNLQVMPGGRLDMGTAQDPVLRNVLFVVSNRRLDARDPYQWGNGIFNLGKWSAHGRPMSRTWTRCMPVEAGETALRLEDQVAWQTGDELLIPDTQQMEWGPVKFNRNGQLVPIRRESPVAIRGMRAPSDGTTTVELLLSKPLDFEHRAAYSPADELRYLPYVANASRNIVIRSENPAGVRGHTVTTGDGSQQLAYVAFIGMGRTRREPLDSTGFVDGVLHVGTNQVGRYPIHWHHGHTAAPDWGLARGLYVDGTDASKWGIIVHGTDDVVVEHCVVNRCIGAGIITEDGPEVRNTFDHNFVMGCLGETNYPYYDPKNAKFAFLGGIPGGEGAGFWFHGTMNTVTNNVACNNIVGIDAFQFRPLLYNYSSQPGGEKDTPYNQYRATPINFSGNVAFANAINGLELWNLPEDARWHADETDCWHNGLHQVALGGGERCSVSLNRLRTLASDGIGIAIHSFNGYHFIINLTNSRLEGSEIGLETTQTLYQVVNTTLNNGLNIDWSLAKPWPGPKRGVVVKNCKATPLEPDAPNIEANFPLPDDIELDGEGYLETKRDRPIYRPGRENRS